MTNFESCAAILTIGFSSLLTLPKTSIPGDHHQDKQPITSHLARDDNPKLYMHAKLSNAQQVMHGLVAEDYEKISSGAKKMKLIAEAAHWPTTVDEVYQHFSFEFRRQCDKLVEQANAKDLRAAHFTYLQMSTTCIDCHDYVRPRFKVEQNNQGPVRLIPTEWNRSTKRNGNRPGPDESDTDT